MFVRLTPDAAAFAVAKVKYHLADVFEPGSITNVPARLAKRMCLDGSARPVTLPSAHYFNPDVARPAEICRETT